MSGAFAIGGDYASGSLYAPSAFLNSNPNTVQAIANAMVRTLKWMATATPDEIIDKVPTDFYQRNRAVYRQALQNNLSSFSRDGLMPRDAPNVVLKAMVKFDPNIAKTHRDKGAASLQAFWQFQLRGLRDQSPCMVWQL